jgi:hypothetical protein
MYEIELWGLRRQLARINRLDDETQKHLDTIAQLNREERAKVERACEEQRQRELACLPAPTPPAPASPHALTKARTLAGLRGTPAPPAPATSPNPVFAELKQRTLAGLRGGL